MWARDTGGVREEEGVRGKWHRPHMQLKKGTGRRIGEPKLHFAG